MANRSLLDRIVRVSMIVATGNCFLMVVITILDVLSRHTLNRPIPGVFELNEVLMVGIVFLGLGMAQKEKTHIRAELLVGRFSRTGQRVFDLAAQSLSLFFWGLLLIQALPQAWQSYAIGEYREGLIKFPIWPARWALAIGLTLLCLQLLRDIYGNLRWNEFKLAGK